MYPPLLLYKAHGPVAPGPGDPQAPVTPLKSLCFLWFSRVGEGGGRRLEMFVDAAGVFWSAEVG